VKLLLDQNLSPRLAAASENAFPGTAHVREHDLQRADDVEIWEFAKQHGFAILSKDADFHQMSFLYGHPPKVVWANLGNRSTDEILVAIQDRRADLAAFEEDDQASFLTLAS